MTHEQFIKRAEEIKQRANDKLDEARRRFEVRFPLHRSARYSGGMVAAIRETGIAGIREQIEAEWAAEMEALDAEFYGEDLTDA